MACMIVCMIVMLMCLVIRMLILMMTMLMYFVVSSAEMFMGDPKINIKAKIDNARL